MNVVGALLAFQLFAQPTPDRSSGQIQGSIVDETGLAIPASVRVISSDTGVLIVRLQTNDDGSFKTQPLPEGRYRLTAVANGFRRAERNDLLVQSGRIEDLGRITLELAGCDPPGVMCDSVGEPPESNHHVIAHARVILKASCAVKLTQTAKVVCPDRGGNFDSVDIRLTQEEGALYLVPANGASLSQAYASNLDCSGVKYELNRMSVAGLGPGVDFCVRTRRGDIAHVFFTEDVETKSDSVSLWYTTRKPR
jgi:hypothetical protein